MKRRSCETPAKLNKPRRDAGYDLAMASTRDQPASEPASQPETKTEAPDSSTGALRYRRYNDSVGSTHNLVVGFVPQDSSVLEFGCATGYMSEVLVDRRGCRVTGIEIDPEAAAAAQAYCDRVIIGDAETLDLNAHLSGELFDAILFADFLEHLRDPRALLRRVRPLVADGGSVIASIPNVAHASVRLALLSGRFRYRQQGLLDESHLRFFTRDSIRDLFEQSGYVVTDWSRVTATVGESELADDARDAPAVEEFLARDPESTTYQFVVRAVPSHGTEQLTAVRAALDEASVELEQLRPLREELRQRTTELEAVRSEFEALRRAHEAQARHLISERLAFADQFESELEPLREEIEWRKGMEKELARLQESRSLRYTEPLRRIAAALRRR
jgi:2-polyprenyl-3-methyl-5-hydroxy-6-metoxy-1,4-benzoquinol methylase